MGREANTLKDRKCLSCGTLYVSAGDLKQHARMCASAKKVGLVLPQGTSLLSKPGLTIIRPGE